MFFFSFLLFILYHKKQRIEITIHELLVIRRLVYPSLRKLQLGGRYQPTNSTTPNLTYNPMSLNDGHILNIVQLTNKCNIK